MTLLERVRGDMLIAQRSGDEIRLGTVRFLLAQLHNREIEKRGAGKETKLSDEEVINIVKREIKKRKEAVELFKRGGREDLIKKEEEELKVLSLYVPAMMSREEIETIVNEIVVRGESDFSALIKEVMQKSGGRAEGRLAAEIIKEKMK